MRLSAVLMAAVNRCKDLQGRNVTGNAADKAGRCKRLTHY